MMLVRLLLLAVSVIAVPDPQDPLLLEYRCHQDDQDDDGGDDDDDAASP